MINTFTNQKLTELAVIRWLETMYGKPPYDDGLYHCKRCDSIDIREYHGDVVNVSGPGDGLVYFSYAACADCGLHAD